MSDADKDGRQATGACEPWTRGDLPGETARRSATGEVSIPANEAPGRQGRFQARRAVGIKPGVSTPGRLSAPGAPRFATPQTARPSRPCPMCLFARELRQARHEPRHAPRELRRSPRELRHASHELRSALSGMRHGPRGLRSASRELRHAPSELRHAHHELRCSYLGVRCAAREGRDAFRGGRVAARGACVAETAGTVAIPQGRVTVRLPPCPSELGGTAWAGCPCRPRGWKGTPAAADPGASGRPSRGRVGSRSHGRRRRG